MTNIVKSWNFGSFEDMAGMVATAPLKELVGIKANVTGIALCEKVSPEGELRAITVMRLDNGKYYGGVSATVYETADLIVSGVTDDIKAIAVELEEKDARSGRKFLSMGSIVALK